MPFWLSVLDHEGIDVTVVLALRHPLDVASSLRARDGLPLSTALLLWLRHELDAEAATRSKRRVCVRYDDVLTDWHALFKPLAAVGGAPRVIDQDLASDIDSLIRPELRHHHGVDAGGDVPPLLSDWIARAWQALTVMAERGAGAVTSQSQLLEAGHVLDAVRGDLDRATAVFGVDAERESMRARRHNADIERDLAEKQLDVERAIHEREAVSQELAASVAEARTIADRLAQSEALRAELAAEHARLSADIAHLSGDVARLSAEKASVEQRADQQMADARSTIAVLHGQIGTLEGEREALKSSMSWRITAPLRAIYRAVR